MSYVLRWRGVIASSFVPNYRKSRRGPIRKLARDKRGWRVLSVEGPEAYCLRMMVGTRNTRTGEPRTFEVNLE